MKLVASMNVRNELERYLPKTIAHLQTYCDEIRVQDDGSDDGSFEWLETQDKVFVQRNDGPAWTEHEGELHQNLLDWTLQGEPTHILAIDADEILPKGNELPELLEMFPHQQTFTLRMCEIWDTRSDPWKVRIDGGWRPHEVAVLYQLPKHLSKKKAEQGEWHIWGRKMAGGRVPRVVRADHHMGQFRPLGLDILHLGWADPSEREKRHRRYVEVDGGNFHASEHLDSIMWPDEKVGLISYRGETPELVGEPA